MYELVSPVQPTAVPVVCRRCANGVAQEEAEQEGREPQAQAVSVKVRRTEFSIRRAKKALLKESWAAISMVRARNLTSCKFLLFSLFSSLVTCGKSH